MNVLTFESNKCFLKFLMIIIIIIINKYNSVVRQEGNILNLLKRIIWVNICPDCEIPSHTCQTGDLARLSGEAAWILCHDHWGWGTQKGWAPSRRIWGTVTAMPVLPVAHWRWAFGGQNKTSVCISFHYTND